MNRWTLLVLATGLASCSCEPASIFFASLGTVAVRPDSGATSCSEPWAELFEPMELNGPWTGSAIAEHGVVRLLIDGGVVRQVLLGVEGRTWRVQQLDTQMQVAVVGRDGTLCGTGFGDGGSSRLRLEFADGGVAEPPTSGPCLGYENGWWVTWSDGNVLRGRDERIESLGNLDAGVIPGVIDPGIVPIVGPVSADGKVIIFVNYHEPGGWILPSRLELRGPTGLGTAAPVGLAGETPIGFNFAPGSRYPYTWDEAGTPHALSLGDASADFVQMASLRGHSDGHLCGALELTGVADYAVAFWKRDGGFVAPGILRSLGVKIDPVDCWPVGRDWYQVVYFVDVPDAGRTPRLALVRLQLDCLSN